MNNSFSQMAFNFGAEEQAPLPPPPASMKAEIGGYAVGQENGYSGVRVRIKSLKNVPKEGSKEAMPEIINEKQLNDPAPASEKQETARVIELKLFDLPPVEEIIKEEIATPDEPVDSVSAEEEAGSVDDTAPEVDNVRAEEVSVPVEEVSIPAEIIDSTPDTDTVSVPAGVADSTPVAVADNIPAPVEVSAPVAEISAPVVEVSVPPAMVSSKVANPPVLDTQVAGSGSPGIIDSGTGSPGKPAKSKRGRKSLKQATAEADLIEVPGDDILFSKQYYTMRAVAEMFRVNQSLLRFWETEFDILQPRKNKKGDRYFRPVDIKNLHLIYHLLRQRKYTIEGAKEFLKKNKKAEERFEAIQRLQEIRAFLLEWKAQL